MYFIVMRKTFTYKLLACIVALIVLCAACSTANPKSEALRTAEQDSEEEDFTVFYNKFHTDSLFQISRISWPLNGNFIQDTTGKAVELGHKLQDWTMHRPFGENQDFVQQFQPLTEDLIIEEIKARAGRYKIERRFARLTGGWQLIYYNVSGI